MSCPIPPRAPRGGTPSNVLTERQEDVLVFIASFTATKGYPPTNREIGEHFGMSSTNAVADHLEALARKHCLTSVPHRARTLQLTEAGRDIVARRQARQQTEAARHA